MNKALAGIGLLLAIHSFTFAANNYKMERLAISDELTQKGVYSIYQDHLGYLWLGGYAGLNRYDGDSVEKFVHDPTDSGSLPNDMVGGIFEDARGVLYVITPRGLASLDRPTNKWQTILNTTPKSCLIESAGYVWLPSEGRGLFRYNLRTGELTVKRHNAQDSLSLASNNLLCIFIDKEQWRWIGYDSSGLECFSPDWRYKKSFSFPRASRGTQRYKVNAITQDAQGRIWVATEFHGLLLAAGDSLLPPSRMPDIHLPASLEKTGIYNLLVDQDRLWIGTDLGLFMYNTTLDSCFSFSPRDDKWPIDSQQAIHGLYKDRQGLLWAGGKNGLFKITPQTEIEHFKNFVPSLPQGQNRIWSFLDEGDSTWIGSDLGLMKWHKTQNTFVLYTPDDMRPNVRAIKRKNRNLLYVLTLGGNLFEFDCQTAEFTQKIKITNEPSSTSTAYCLAPTPDGDLWIGLNGEGLVHYSPKSNFSRQYRYPSVDAPNWIIDIEKDAARRCLWCATWRAGLWRFDLDSREFHDENETIQKHSSQKQPTILCLLGDARDGLWLGTLSDGLLHYNPETKAVHSYTIADNLPSNIIYSMSRDENGHIWLGTANGLACFDPEGRHCKSYNLRDGLQDLEFNVGAAAKTSHGGLLFGGANGFNLIKPKENSNAFPPRIALKKIDVFGKSRPVGRQYSRDHILRFSYKENFLTLSFSVLHFKNPTRNQLKYRMTNLSNKWINLQGRRDISLTDPKPGKYTLELLAANSDGVWMTSPYQLTVQIRPPLWQTPWFFIGLGLALAGIIGGAVALNLHRRLEIQRIKKQERDEMQRRMAADFHDIVGARLTKISMTGHALQRALRGSKSRDMLFHIIAHSQAIYEEMRAFIWGINDENNTLYKLALKISETGQELFVNTSIDFEVQGIRDDYKEVALPSDWCVNLLRVFNEAMHNCLKHSGAANVIFRCRKTDRILMLQISDDGKGFDESELQRTNGLKNMKKRCADIGADLLINAKKGEGVCITASLTLG